MSTSGSDGWWLLGGVIDSAQIAYNTVIAANGGSVNAAVGVINPNNTGIHGGTVNGPVTIHDNYVDPTTLDGTFAYGNSAYPGISTLDSNYNMLTGMPFAGANAPNSPLILTNSISGNTVNLTGTADATTTIKVYDSSNLIGTTTANSSGKWTFTTGSLANGTHTLTATETSSSGTSAASFPVTATVGSGGSGPTIAQVVEFPSTGDLNAGNTVTLTLNLSEATTVAGGTPTLTLNDGGVATYTGGSGTNALTFSYTVGAGQNTAALAATAVNLNGATMKDSSGNAANLSLTGLTQSGPQIGTTTPVISSIAETPSSGDLNAGKTVAYTLTMNEAVTVNTTGGSPTLTLNDGGTATYTGGSGTNALTFSYTVLAGQNTPDLTVSTVNLNGATLLDGAGNAANLSLTGLTQGSPQIDTSAPTTPNNLLATAASSSQINLSWTASSDNSAVTGYEIFRNGTLVGTSTTNSYSDTGLVASTPYNYTVEAYDGAGNLSPQSAGASATTQAPVAWTNLAFPTQSSTFTASFDATPSQAAADITIGLSPTTAAAFTDLAAIVRFNSTNTIDARNGSSYGAAMSVPYSAGTNYHFVMVVNLSADTYSVYVTPQGGSQIALATNYAFRTEQATDASLSDIGEAGSPGSAPILNFLIGPTITSTTQSPSSGDLSMGHTVALTLNMSEVVTVNTTNGTPTLTLNDGAVATYTGGSGTNALTFSYTVGAGQNAAGLAVTGVNLNGGTIADAAGSSANLSLTGLTQTGPKIDTSTPVITAIAELPASGDLNAGKTVTYTLAMNELVTVNTAGGSPTLALNDGGTATYVSGSGTNALTFSYTVLAGQNTPDLMVSAVNLNGASVMDGAGNAANLSLSGLSQGSPSVDTTPPALSSVSATAGSYNTGKTLTLTLNMSEVVNVTGTPTLTLNDGGTATYTGGSGSGALTFSYTVASGQNTAGLAVTAVNGTITDLAGNALTTANLPANFAGVVIGTTAPTVSSVVASGTGITAGSGDLAAGSVVTLTVNLSSVVTVAGGTPTLTLNDGGTATYTGGSGTSALTFSYTVGAGQNTADLAVTASTSIRRPSRMARGTRPASPAPSPTRPARCRSTPRRPQCRRWWPRAAVSRLVPATLQSAAS